MELIVSSLTFYKTLLKALEIDCHCITADGNNIGFLTKKYQQDFYCSFENRYKNSSEAVRFNNLKMVRMLDFLKILPDQPVVVKIDNESASIEQIGIVRF